MKDFSRDIDIGYPNAPIDDLMSLVSTTNTRLTLVVSTINEAVSDLWGELIDTREQQAVLTEQIISKLGVLGLSNAAIGASVVSGLDASIQAASALSVTQRAGIISELVALGSSADIVNATLDIAIEELRKLHEDASLILGQDIEGV